MIGLATVAALVAGAAVSLVARDLPRMDNESEYTGSVIPEFDSWPEMEEFIDQRHARLREYAQSHPDDTLSVSFTPTRALTVEELQAIAARYRADAVSVEYSAGPVWGTSSLSLSVTVESIEQEARGQGVVRGEERLAFTFMVAHGRAEDLALMSEDPLTALLDATATLDLREGLRPADELVNPPRSVFRDYQRLAPGGAGDVGYGTPWPLSTPP